MDFLPRPTPYCRLRLQWGWRKRVFGHLFDSARCHSSMEKTKMLALLSQRSQLRRFLSLYPSLSEVLSCTHRIMAIFPLLSSWICRVFPCFLNASVAHENRSCWYNRLCSVCSIHSCKRTIICVAIDVAVVNVLQCTAPPFIDSSIILSLRLLSMLHWWEAATIYILPILVEDDPKAFDFTILYVSLFSAFVCDATYCSKRDGFF